MSTATVTTATALKHARKALITNGVELIETLADGTRCVRPIPAGQSPRLALANARRSLAERLMSDAIARAR